MTGAKTRASGAIKLSRQQQRVIDHRGSPLQVVACAGSGKTESISRRIAALIAEGTEPSAIVAFTFTERAASELKDRIVHRVEERMGRPFLDRLGPMFVGTIHAYCFRILQDHVPRFGNHDVLDEHRHAGLLSREYRRLNLSSLGARHWGPIQQFLRTADVIANELIDPSSLTGTPVGACYRAYLETLDRYHFLTYGQIIAQAVRAFDDPIVFGRVHGPLRHLVVDEYQDINPAQESLIRKLAAPPVELCVVGDDDQSIYQWRGSDVANILTFARRHRGTATASLEDNRRSRPEIIRAANAFAKTIPDRLPKRMRAKRDPGRNELVAWSAETENDEADRVAETIYRLHRIGYRWRDIAVLYRSVRTSAPPLIDALRARDIPFSCVGRTGLFMQPEIALFGEAFCWLADGEWKDSRYEQSRKADPDLVAYGLHGSFGTRSAKQIRKYLDDWKAYHLRANKTVNLIGDLYKLLAFLDAQRIDIDTAEGSARFGAFARFSELLADFEHVNRRGRYVIEDGGERVFRGGQDRGVHYFRGLANYLLHYARDAYEDFEGEPAADFDAVDVLTIHQSKGLEWPVVFMPALVDSRFPSRRAGRPQEWLLPESVFPPATRRRYEGGDAEERRLFYVALTRARDVVYLSTFERRTNRFRPSPYLIEVAGDKRPRLKRLPLPDSPGETKEDKPPALEVSYSDLALYDDCGHRYRLGSLFGFQQELAQELGYGKAIHHVLRQIAELARANGTVPELEEVRSLVDAEFYVPFANRPAFERMYQATHRLVRTYIEKHSSDLRRIWAIERPFELHVEAGIVKGRADVILDEERGRIGSLALVDYKVAHDEERDERYRRQLAIYAAAGRGEGLSVEAAYLHELRDGSRHGVDIGDTASREAVCAVEAAVGNIRGGNYPARPEQSKCCACDYERICPHGKAPNE
jgi:DNA helicase-2/ATP-dependent DNA helicase PcrA